MERPSFSSVPRRCKRCGTELGHTGRQLCDACLEAHQAVAVEVIKYAGVGRLRELRAKGKDPAHTGEANAKRGAKVSEEAAARAAWDHANDGQLDPATFARHIAPHLDQYSVRSIRAATGLSLQYCALVRKGERVPHARHWSSLLQLVADS